MIFRQSLRILSLFWIAAHGCLLGQIYDPTYSGIDRPTAPQKQKTLVLEDIETTLSTVQWPNGVAYVCKQQSDGGIVVASYSGRNLLVTRFKESGFLDRSFANNGHFLSSGFQIWYEGGMGMDVQSDGCIVVAVMNYFSGIGNITLFRLTPQGQLDQSFGGSGVLGKSVSSRAFLKRLFVLPDGKILTGGNCPSGIWAARYLSNGDPDSSFGTKGVSIISQPTQNNHSGQIGQLQPLPDGKMLLMSLAIQSATREAWVLDRLTASGGLDSSFQKIVLPFDASNSWIGSFATLTDGRIGVERPKSILTTYGLRVQTDDTGMYSSEGRFQNWNGFVATGLIGRSDGSLCGWMSGGFGQILPKRQLLTTSSRYEAYSMANGEFVLVGSTGNHPVCDRFSQNGTLIQSYYDGPRSLALESSDASDEEDHIRFESLDAKFGFSKRPMTLKNLSGSRLQGISLTFTGPNADEFSFQGMPSSLNANESQTGTLVFEAKGVGKRTATIVLKTSNSLPEGSTKIAITADVTSISGLPVLDLISASTNSPLTPAEKNALFSWAPHPLSASSEIAVALKNSGKAELTNARMVIEGEDADQFIVSSPLPKILASGATTSFALRFQPTRVGLLNATLTIYSNDPFGPLVVPLRGTGTFEITATKAIDANSPFTYAPLRADRQTGLILQNIVFTNTSGVLLDGLRLILSKVPRGVLVYSSSVGKSPDSLEVIYSNAIKPGETITFDLVYFDPIRRTSYAINRIIKAEALLEPEADSLPVAGKLVTQLRTKTTSQGPFLEWNSVSKATYVVEYSDDAGKTWFSAVHRLRTPGTRIYWVDRGQPETKTKPVGVPNTLGGRFYRVKKL